MHREPVDLLLLFFVQSGSTVIGLVSVATLIFTRVVDFIFLPSIRVEWRNSSRTSDRWLEYIIYLLNLLYTLYCCSYCCNNFRALIMASTSPEPRDKRDRCNVGVSSDKIQATQVLSAPAFSNPLAKDSLTGLMSRKLLTTKRLLVLDMKALSSSLKKCKLKEEFCKITLKFEEISVSHNDFRKALDEVTDIEIAAELSDHVAHLFEGCSNSHEFCKQRYFYRLDDNCDQITEIKVTDSVSQVSRGISSSTSKATSAARLIELECKRSALRAARDLELAKAQEAAIEAETKARFSIEEEKLEAELKLIELSERG